MYLRVFFVILLLLSGCGQYNISIADYEDDVVWHKNVMAMQFSGDFVKMVGDAMNPEKDKVISYKSLDSRQSVSDQLYTIMGDSRTAEVLNYQLVTNSSGQLKLINEVQMKDSRMEIRFGDTSCQYEIGSWHASFEMLLKSSDKGLSFWGVAESKLKSEDVGDVSAKLVSGEGCPLVSLEESVWKSLFQFWRQSLYSGLMVELEVLSLRSLEDHWPVMQHGVRVSAVVQDFFDPSDISVYLRLARKSSWSNGSFYVGGDGVGVQYDMALNYKVGKCMEGVKEPEVNLSAGLGESPKINSLSPGGRRYFFRWVIARDFLQYMIRSFLYSGYGCMSGVYEHRQVVEMMSFFRKFWYEQIIIRSYIHAFGEMGLKGINRLGFNGMKVLVEIYGLKEDNWELIGDLEAKVDVDFQMGIKNKFMSLTDVHLEIKDFLGGSKLKGVADKTLFESYVQWLVKNMSIPLAGVVSGIDLKLLEVVEKDGQYQLYWGK